MQTLDVQAEGNYNTIKRKMLKIFDNQTVQKVHDVIEFNDESRQATKVCLIFMLGSWK